MIFALARTPAIFEFKEASRAPFFELFDDVTEEKIRAPFFRSLDLPVRTYEVAKYDQQYLGYYGIPFTNESLLLLL